MQNPESFVRLAQQFNNNTEQTVKAPTTPGMEPKATTTEPKPKY